MDESKNKAHEDRKFIFELLKERTDLSVWRNTTQILKSKSSGNGGVSVEEYRKKITHEGEHQDLTNIKAGQLLHLLTLQINYSVLGYADYTCSFQPTSSLYFAMVIAVGSISNCCCLFWCLLDSPVGPVLLDFPLRICQSSTHH